MTRRSIRLKSVPFGKSIFSAFFKKTELVDCSYAPDGARLVFGCQVTVLLLHSPIAGKAKPAVRHMVDWWIDHNLRLEAKRLIDAAQFLVRSDRDKT